MIKLSVIIPAYNEEQRITATLRDIHSTLSRQLFDYEILVVSDGSSDGTALVVEGLKKEIPSLSLIDNRENHGKGYVVRQGMRRASGRYRLFMDADNSTKVEEVLKMFPYVDQGFDVVIGSRCLPDSKIVVRQNWARDFLGSVFKRIVRILVPLSVVDSQCGFKLFTEKAVNIIFPQQTISRWAFDVEILAISRKEGLRIKEVPIVWRNDSASRMNFLDMVRTFFEIVQVRWRVRG